MHYFSLLHRYRKNKISDCGLIIDVEECFLATSPFRYVDSNGIIVIKCPVKAYKEKSIQDAIVKKLIPFWKLESRKEIINKNSAWHIEIQGQLHISMKSFAYLVVWIESEFKIKKIIRDDDFWDAKMKAPLIYFYQQVMLKELINPRKNRNMPLRAYNPATETFE